jgi:aerobic carbon-monoxide dehydrogenase medium subunit
MNPSVHVARTIEDAAAALAEAKDAAPLAGGTWIMRSPIRSEAYAPRYVALGAIEAMKTLEATEREIRLGAGATHAALARFLEPFPEFAGLRAAAASSANPSVRNMATLGGNLCAGGFAASDLAPALLSIDASVDLISASGEARLTLSEFLTQRAAPGALLTHVTAHRSNRRSAHIRLPLRKAGDYPVAIVSVSAEVDADRVVKDPRIAVGSVEPFARRWTSLERATEGAQLGATNFAQLAGERSGDFIGRDGVEAPGWYRVKVLPGLVAKAFAGLASRSLAA